MALVGKKYMPRPLFLTPPSPLHFFLPGPSYSLCDFPLSFFISPSLSSSCVCAPRTRLFLGQWSHVTAVARGGSSRYRTDYFTEILEYEDRGKRKDSLKRVMEALMMDVVALVTVLGTGGGEADMQEALSAVEGACLGWQEALMGARQVFPCVPLPPIILPPFPPFPFNPHLSHRRSGGVSGLRVPEHARPVRAPPQCGV